MTMTDPVELLYLFEEAVIDGERNGYKRTVAEEIVKAREAVLAVIRPNQPSERSEPADASASIEAAARIRERYEKLAGSPLGMSSPWERKASNGKPLLYGGKRGLLAYGTIATWDEFDLIVDVINNLPALLAAAQFPATASFDATARPPGSELHIGTAAGTAAFKNTDGAPVKEVLEAIQHCALSWEWSARIIGNIRAVDISRACSFALGALAAPQPTARMDQDAFLELAHLETRKRYRALMAAGFVDSFVEGAKWATALAQQPNQRGWLLIKDAPLDISGPVWSPEPAWANRTDIAGEVKSHESGVRYVVGQFLGFKPTHWHPPVTPPLAAEPQLEGKI